MQPAHHGADRDVEDLGRVCVAELADVDEYEHVAEVVRHVASASTIEPCDSFSITRSSSERLAVALLELVVEVVVAVASIDVICGVRCWRGRGRC